MAPSDQAPLFEGGRDETVDCPCQDLTPRISPRGRVGFGAKPRLTTGC